MALHGDRGSQHLGDAGNPGVVPCGEPQAPRVHDANPNANPNPKLNLRLLDAASTLAFFSDMEIKNAQIETECGSLVVLDCSTPHTNYPVIVGKSQVPCRALIPRSRDQG